MNGRFLLSTLGLCGIFLTGCTVYDPGLLPENGSPGIGDPPPRPDDSTSDPTDTGNVVFAFRNVVLDQGADWETIGFDLDGYDTQEATGFQRECTPYSASGSPEIPTDGVDGIDNQFGAQIWSVMKTVLPTLECEINESFLDGHGTLIMMVEKWNGNRDDASIKVSIVPAVDGTAAAITSCSTFVGEEVQFGGGDASPPDWMGALDRYCVNDRGISAITGEAFVLDENAYIVGGRIIMSLLPGTEFVLYSSRSSVAIKLYEGRISAQLNGDLNAIDYGFASGRFAMQALLDVGEDIGVCDPTAYQDVYREVADVLALEDPSAPPTTECNAVSIGVSFDGIQALWQGTAAADVPPKTLCLGDDTWAVPHPVQACCSAYPSPAQVAACDAYWNP